MCNETKKLLASYEKAAREALKKGSEEIFDNYSYEHAECLTELMYKHTKEKARIVTGKLDCMGGETSRIASSFMEMVNRGVKTEVILTENAPAWLLDLAEKKSNLTVKILPQGFEGDKSHKLLLDDKMIRVEELHGSDEKDVHAKVSFNRPDVVEALSSAFEETFSQLHSA